MDQVLLLPKDQVQYILSGSANTQPLISDKLKLNYPSLLDVNDINLQQALIINDLFFVLIGLEGNYIRYSHSFVQTQRVVLQNNSANPLNSAELQVLLNGPDFKISKNLNPSLKDLTKSIIKLGKIFYALNQFKCFFDNSYFGKTNQSFASFIRSLIKEYLSNLNKIYFNFQNSPNYSILLMSNDLKERFLDLKLKSLYEICHLIYNDTKKRLSQNDDFYNLINNLKKDYYSNNELDLNSDNSKFSVCKGGLILKIINQQIQKNQGNPEILHFLNQLFNEVSQNYLLMLNSWLVNGSINDPFNEFLVKSNQSEKKTDNLLDNIARINTETNLGLQSNPAMEHYWDSKFSIRRDGLPKQLEDVGLRNKILLTGTYLNIAKDCGVIVRYTDFENMLYPDSRVQQYYVKNLADINLLNLQVEYWYMKANKLIMELFYEGYDFLSILQDFKNFYFLNSNLFSSLVGNNLDLLRKRKHSHYLDEFRNEFQYFLGFSNYSEDCLILTLGELSLERNDIFTELQEILNVKPINPEGIFNSSSYQALKNMVNESIVPSRHAGNDEASELPPSTHVSFDEYLINYINFDIILPFPLNLIICQTEIIKFQLVFRFLLTNMFFLKLFDDNFINLNAHKVSRKSVYFNKITRLSVLNFRFSNLLRKLYLGYLTVIDANFNLNFKALSVLENSLPAGNSSFPNTANASSLHNFTFEDAKQKIQDLLDNILLYSHLTDADYLKLTKFFFKILVNFTKFTKKFLKEVSAVEKSQGYSFVPEESQHSNDTSTKDSFIGEACNKYFAEFQSYYEKFSKEFSNYS